MEQKANIIAECKWINVYKERKIGETDEKGKDFLSHAVRAR